MCYFTEKRGREEPGDDSASFICRFFDFLKLATFDRIRVKHGSHINKLYSIYKLPIINYLITLLSSPQPLSVGAVAEAVVKDNIGVFNASGFQFAFPEGTVLVLIGWLRDLK